ncbi:MAG: LLM class flavin-dependent oxidoreductase [Pseudomonadota bacterium]
MSVRLGLFYPNAKAIHTISGKVAARNPDVLSMKEHVDIAGAAERIGLDYLFMADAWGFYGPKTTAIGLQNPMLVPPILAASLIPVTDKIRFITTVHTSWFEPLQYIRMGAALDQLSNGRWGINIVSGSGFADQITTDTQTLSHDARYRRASEFVDVVTQFWSTGTIDYHGDHFRIKGAIVGPPTIQQPRPLIVSAGASDAGRDFAGRHADCIFMPGRTSRNEMRARMQEIRKVAAVAGRPADAIKVQMHASIVVRETNAEAREYSDWIAQSVDLQGVAEYLNAVRSNISTYDDIYASLGELQMRQIGSVSGARRIHGGPVEVADGIATLISDFGCDGIAITLPLWNAEEIERLGKLVLPILEERGLWSPPSTRDFGW